MTAAKRDSRVERERRTIEAMVSLFCRGHHEGQDDLCPGCGELLEYALQRLKLCKFQEKKPTCAKCPVHCYRPEMRERIKAVMRYAGPRMLVHHPLLTMHHVLDGLKG
jgi:predicted amidophosphoribosyltransferase